MKFSAIQYSCSDEPSRNIEKAEALIRRSAKKGADLIALQELFHTTYFCREVDQKYFNWAETIPGPITRRFCEVAKELGVVLLLPIFEKKAPGVYFNTMVVIEKDGAILGTYRKMHIPDDPGFYEKYYFTPGDNGFKVFETSVGKIGTLICWDQWFPEAARLASLSGAELLVYPTAIGTLPEESETDKHEFLDAWLTIQRSHAIANGCFVAGVNRVGVEEGTKFWGNSFVAGPFGKIIDQCREEEEILTVDINFSEIEKHRQTWPFFRDRRIDAYSDILKRFI